MLDFGFAYVAGLLTLLNPCVLPLLPLILASAVTQNRYGPLALAGGLATGFTIAGILAYSLLQALGLYAEDIAWAGALVMIAFGLVLIVPQANLAFARASGALANGGGQALARLDGSGHGNGLAGQAAAGLLLGLVWSPCIGPTLGGAIALASAGESLSYAFAIMAVFSLGSATVVFALAYGSRELIARRRSTLMAVSQYAKPIMGAALVAVGLAILFRIDQLLEFWALTLFPEGFFDLSVMF